MTTPMLRGVRLINATRNGPCYGFVDGSRCTNRPKLATHIPELIRKAASR